MAIQDKIFDVQAALEGKPEAELFDELYTYICDLERQNEDLLNICERQKITIETLKES